MIRYLFLATFILFNFDVFVYAEELTINERLDCSIKASVKYGVPADILLAISSIENGKIGKIYKNKDGSFDYGVMQINSIYLKDLELNYNKIVTPEEVTNNTCYAFEIASFKIDKSTLDILSIFQSVFKFFSINDSMFSLFFSIPNIASWIYFFAFSSFISLLSKNKSTCSCNSSCFVISKL